MKQLPGATAATLRLVVRCHSWLLALGAHSVDRVAASVDLPRPAPPPHRSPQAEEDGALGLIAAGPDRYAAWDLGRLLGLGDVEGAWVLVRLAVGGRSLAVALRTGPCVAVTSLAAGAVTPLPAAAFRSERRAALHGAFSPDSLGIAERAAGGVGLEILPEKLFSGAELELSESWLVDPSGARE